MTQPMRILLLSAFFCLSICVPVALGAGTIIPNNIRSPLQSGRTVSKGAPLSRRIPLSIIIRGGSSLGAYEAGYLYILTEAIKRNPEYFTPDVLSGASAGTINAILSVLSLGKPPTDNPLESVYYRSWAQLNFRDLIDVGSAATPPRPNLRSPRC